MNSDNFDKVYSGNIRYSFRFEKLNDLLTYLAGAIEGLDKLKAVKFIYLADRLHLLRHVRPIVGDRYVHLQYGPVPSLSFDYINDLINPERDVVPTEYLSKLQKRFKIIYAKPYPILETNDEYELDNLSESEILILEEIVRKYGRMPGTELINLTHQHNTWLNTKPNETISYKLFFENAPEAVEGAYEFMLETQDDRDFIDFLNG